MSDKPKIIGVDKRYYPAQAGVVTNHLFENPPPTLAVLVEGEIGDYACYVGHGTPEWVARFGDKIRFEEACCHFPDGQLVKEKYRK